MASAQALVLNFVDIESEWLANNMSEVNFIAPWNDFGGMFFRLAQKSLITPEEISVDSDILLCYKQLRGLYYNAQRGERVWPLDSDTLDLLQESSSSYDALTVDGWLYTFCSWTGVDTRSIVWQMQYDDGSTQSYILAWLDYNYAQNSYSVIFSDSLQYFINTTPIWYIYDTIGGIWFVWWLYTAHDAVLDAINSGQSITEIFQQSGQDIVAYDIPIIMWATGRYATPWYIAIDGIVGITTALSWSQSNYMSNNQEYATVLPTTSFTTADITNQLRKKASRYCQWRPNATNITDPWTVLCFQYETYNESNSIDIDLSLDAYADKTIFVKNGNIHLIWTMDASSSPINIFIDNGNILWDTAGVSLVWFDEKGNPDVSGVARWLFLKGNILIDWLIMPAWTASFDHKLYVHGKILSLHTPDIAPVWRQTHILQKFAPYDYSAFIDLETIFAWRCNPATWLWNDGTTCWLSTDPYAFAPFVLIDTYIPSLLIQ